MFHLIYTFTLFLSVIFIIVLVHELGHFSLAKLFAIKVLRFSIGFGKPFFTLHDKKGTEYTIAPILLGGYVKLLDSREAAINKGDYSLAFDHRPLYQRLLVLFAGPLFNILFAVLTFWIVFTHGITYVKPIVKDIYPGSPAARMELHRGDQITAIGEKQTTNWAAVAMALIYYFGENRLIPVSVIDGDTHINKVLKLDLKNLKLNPLQPNLIGSLGISPWRPQGLSNLQKTQWPASMLVTQRFPLLPAFSVAFNETINFIGFNYIVLYKTITGVVSWRSLGGPISIFQAATLAATQGAIIYFNFLALLSISIATINLLPIPGLDGAQIFYLFIELILRRPVSIAVQVLAFRLGFIFLLLILIQVSINDVLRLITKI